MFKAQKAFCAKISSKFKSEFSNCTKKKWTKFHGSQSVKRSDMYLGSKSKIKQLRIAPYNTDLTLGCILACN